MDPIERARRRFLDVSAGGERHLAEQERGLFAADQRGGYADDVAVVRGRGRGRERRAQPRLDEPLDVALAIEAARQRPADPDLRRGHRSLAPDHRPGLGLDQLRGLRGQARHACDPGLARAQLGREALLDHAPHRLQVDVTDDDDRHVFRPIVRLGEALRVLEGDRREALVGSNHRTRVGVPCREHSGLHEAEDRPVIARLVALTELAPHHLALDVRDLLGDGVRRREQAHALEEQEPGERLLRADLVIRSLVEAR